MISMPPRHLPSDLPLEMILTPHTNFLIQTLILTLIFMIRRSSFTRIGMIHLRLGTITRGMEGSFPGTGKIPRLSNFHPKFLPTGGIVVVAMLI